MSTIASTFPNGRNSLLRSSVIAGLIIGTADVIIYHWFVTSVLGGIPLISVYQYITSGAFLSFATIYLDKKSIKDLF